MTAPLLDAANRYLDSGFSRFHMPGHKGQPLPGLGGFSKYDLTEIPGLDSLYHAEGAIAQVEAAYTKLYGTKGSLISAGGSTLCIQAMLSLAVPPGGKVLAARGVHTAATSAMALLDLRPVWIYPVCDPASGMALAVTPAQIETALMEHPDIGAVYLTSPTYYGVISDIAGIGDVCKKRGVPLLVDNAHGAHLHFLPASMHPASLGADICCDSLHKTLPVLTGGALLHIQKSAYLVRAKERMALFGSTSPSYLVMLSIDSALSYIINGLPGDLERVSKELAGLAELAGEKKLRLPPGSVDPLRLTLGFGGAGYGREQFSALLSDYKIEPEYMDSAYCVLIAGGMNSTQDFQRLHALMESIQPGSPLPCPGVFSSHPRMILTPRQAVFSPIEEISVEKSAGRVASGMVTPCPPGIPLLAAGEQIQEDHIPLLKNSGIFTLNVVKLSEEE